MRDYQSKKTRVALWTVQAILAALFLFAGAMKLVMPIEVMQQGPIALPEAFLRFIGVCEVSGALGLILPGLLKIKPVLTPWAAIGLVVIMAGAVAVTVEGGSIAGAVVPLVVGILAATVARARWAGS